MSEVKSVEETTVPTSPLTGKALLQKVKELSHLAKRETAMQCGYVKITKSGVTRTDLSGFYDAVLSAKGVKLDKNIRHNRRKTKNYKPTVHEKGQLSIDADYNKHLGLQEGDAFEISWGVKHIQHQGATNKLKISPNLTQIIEQSAALLPQERLELATHLQASQNSPDRWDLSEATIAKRNVEMRQILAEWRDMGDEGEQTETWEELNVALDRDRLSSNRSFFPAE